MGLAQVHLPTLPVLALAPNVAPQVSPLGIVSVLMILVVLSIVIVAKSIIFSLESHLKSPLNFLSYFNL